MPQFDNVTFFNQIFWFLIIFLSFYFIVLKKLLPVLATTLKTRKKLMNYIFSGGSANLDDFFKKSLLKNTDGNLKSSKNSFSLLDKNKLIFFDVVLSKSLNYKVVN
jgi:hypothetical protein